MPRVEYREVLILRREFRGFGQSRLYQRHPGAGGGSSKKVGDLLVDLHGQHDHQPAASGRTPS